ncbi:response regulator [Pseudoalteromonas spongiae]|jgi:DNA-binding response OmpR family regulator|uniref:response regulator n=1 Tax=Pseudoalteromonas spongiae TaxID=298657 RepID=UPI00110B8390|nr:response regulator [Pseudoalteromonas spongiae]TMO82155.1 DNA-binding response regulator [Pseudoalteromonas spongiae]
MRLLLVEDDGPLARGLKTSLQNAGYAVDWVALGELAVKSFQGADYQLVILDLGLPDIDGLLVLSQLKAINAAVPVLILTARSDIDSKVTGLDQGADDYLAKPFDVAELMARIRVLERRSGTNHAALIQIRNVTLNTENNQLLVDNQAVDLSRKEYMVLRALMENTNRIQSKLSLEEKLYDWGEEISSNTIEVHISNLRKRLPAQFIATVRGVGYLVKE